MPSPKLTRRELYNIVWSTPLSKLATEFGISDVGLKNACDRHRVPTPPRGYWAKLEAGQKPNRAIFVEVTDPELNQIEIGSHVAALPEPVRRIMEARKVERKLAVGRQRVVKPITYDPVVDVHPAVRKTVQALRRCKPTEAAVNTFGEGLCGVSVGRETVERAVYVLDGLARLLAQSGMPLVPTGEAMKVTVGPDSAVMTLKERTRTVAHVPTASELAEEARRKEQSERHWRNPGRYPAPPYGPVYPQKDIVWTGELSLEIEGYGDGVRRKWADGRTQRVEDLGPAISDGIAVLLAARKVEREKRDEQARIQAELSRRRALARAREDREKARTAFFESLVTLRRGADDLRRALEELGGGDQTPGDGQVSRMMAWGQARLCGLEKQLQREAVEGRLSEAKLFPADGEDELHDPLGEPPPIKWW